MKGLLVRDDILHGCQETTADPPQFFELRASVARNQAEMEATCTLFVGIIILQRQASKSTNHSTDFAWCSIQ